MADQVEAQVARTLEIIERTPRVVRSMLEGLPSYWVEDPERGGGWSPNEMLGHWIHGEVEDWIPRMRMLLDPSSSEPFPPFEVERYTEFCLDRSTNELLDHFERVRAESVRALREAPIDAAALALTGGHPAFGTVTLAQLLATWSTHDLSHIAQLGRVLAKRQSDDVGPWREFIPILSR